MKKKRLTGVLLALIMLVAISGCGSAGGTSIGQEELPDGTAALELLGVGKRRGTYYIKCLPYDVDVTLLSEEICRLPLAEDVTLSFYPMNTPGSTGERYDGAGDFYLRYDASQMKGLMFWTYQFDENGALCYLSDEVPREYIVQERPVEDFYGCWDFTGSFWQPGLEMYNVPGIPPCGDYIVLHENNLAEVYIMEKKKAYLAYWEMRGSSACIEDLYIWLSFTSLGLEDSNGHNGKSGTLPPAAACVEWVDLT